MAPRLKIDPPLLNAACPWATDLSYLRPLYASSSTGAITTRTSLVDGYPHDDKKNTFLFFNPADATSTTGVAPTAFPSDSSSDGRSASLNCFGLSPLYLAEYLEFVRTLAADFPSSRKPIIVSVTGSTPESNAAAVRDVLKLVAEVRIPLAVEINLSCPNVPGVPPPAYDADELKEFLDALPSDPNIPVGLKVPPYTHAGQFNMIVAAVAAAQPRISFLTSTNTLGNCVVHGRDGPVLPSAGGMGGMAGPPIHPLSLGNVATLRELLDAAGLTSVDIIGVGGVSDAAGYKRMRAAGASAVAVATALGRHGPPVFDRILKRSAKL